MSLLSRLLNFTNRLKNLFKPAIILTISSLMGIYTLFLQFLQFRPLTIFRPTAFKEIWFANLWTTFGPISAENDGVHVNRVVEQAYGVVLDMGPGSGLTLKRLDRKNVVRVFGLEPNKNLHGELRENIRKEGLGEVYTIIGCGVEDTAEMAKYGIKPGSLDTILSIKVLCSVSRPGAVAKSLYDLLAPGGQWLVYEHVQNERDLFTKGVQAIYQMWWPHLLSGCNINRRTGDILLNAGEWEFETNETFGPLESENKWEVIPHVIGRLVKPRYPSHER